MRRNFERAVRGEMKFALRHGGDDPVLYAVRRASGLRQQRGGAFDGRAASVAARRLQEGKSPDDCETCGNTGIHPRPKRVQAMVAERGLPVVSCRDCDRSPVSA